MPVAIRAFSHVVLPVADLDAALAFYRDVLGLEVAMRLEPDDAGADGGIASGLRIAAVLVPGGTLLELAQGMGQPSAGSTVVALNVQDVQAAEREIRAAGIEPTMPPTQVVPGVTMMFVKDPDGRTVELVEFASGANSSYENLDASTEG
jgi:glyoxylase I family protein